MVTAVRRRSQRSPDYARGMGTGTGFILSLLFAAVMLYALYFVIRAGVEAGIRRALPDSQLRPEVDESSHSH